MAVSVDQLGKAIVAAGVLPADELKAFWTALPAAERPKDGESLAALLVQQEKLTEFQLQELLRGSGMPLVLGDYLLLSKIGAGGMGQVFKARHRHMDRLVAVKLLPEALTRDEAAVKRFQREVKAAAKLAHAQIVQAYDAGVQRGVWYLVMEYVEGRDLSAVVKQEGPLPVDTAVNYVLQAARGLEYAHSAGVVHRDIKPGNLLVDKKGTIKILDMGLARIETHGDVAAQAELTGTGAVMGTVDYMAPEQAISTKGVDGRADVYSLGCTLFYLLNGRPAYAGDTITAKLIAHQSEPIPDLQAACAEATPELAAVFERMLAKSAAERYPSMTDVIAALERLDCNGRGSGIHGSSSIAPLAVAPASEIAATLPHRVSITPVIARERTKTTPHLAAGLAPASSGDAAPNNARGRAPRLNKKRAMIFAGGTLACVAIVVGLVFALKPPNEEPIATIPAGSGPPPEVAPTTNPETNAPGVAGRAPREVAAPLPAVAPFSAAAAKEYQQAWAEHLGLAVENEVTLPGGAKLTLVLIPPGEFLMGSSDADRAKFIADATASKHPTCAERIPAEGPQHRVRITRPFYLAKYETTQAQWVSVMGDNPSQFPNDPDQPVESLSWNAVQPFLEKLNDAEPSPNLTFALPTEAQWEYACRGGGTTAWHTGDGADELLQAAWFRDDVSTHPHPVGLLQANPFGLHDLHGNVWEWCADWHSNTYYAESPTDDPPGPAAQTCRVQRGGGWSDRAKYGRSAFRYEMQPDVGHNHYGFRLAASIAINPGAK